MNAYRNSYDTCQWFNENLFQQNECSNVSDFAIQLDNVNQTEMPKPYRQPRFVVDIYIVSFVCLVGFVGNALTIAVLCRDRDKANTTNWLLQTLAVADTIYLICCIFTQPLKAIHEATGGLPRLFPYAEPYIWPITSIAQTITIWTVVVLTADRYLAVCHPFNAGLRTMVRIKVATIGIFVGAVVYNIPMFFERELVYDQNSATKVKSLKTQMGGHQLYAVIYKTACHFVLRAIGPLVVLIILNFLLIQELRSTRRRKSLSSSQSVKHRENITLMLVVVVSVFIVCQIPDLIMRIVATQYQPILLPDATDYVRFLNSIINLMLTLNSSINFLIYCLIGKKFRRIFFQVFLSNLCRKNLDAKDVKTTEVNERLLHAHTMDITLRNGSFMEAASNVKAKVEECEQKF